MGLRIRFSLFVRINQQSELLVSCFKNKVIKEEASRGAGAQSVPVNRLAVGSIPNRGNEIFIYLHVYFHFFALVSRGKCGLEFRHSTRNDFRNWRRVGNGVS